MSVLWPGVAPSRYPAPLLRWELRLEPEYDYPASALLSGQPQYKWGEGRGSGSNPRISLVYIRYVGGWVNPLKISLKQLQIHLQTRIIVPKSCLIVVVVEATRPPCTGLAGVAGEVIWPSSNFLMSAITRVRPWAVQCQYTHHHALIWTNNYLEILVPFPNIHCW